MGPILVVLTAVLLLIAELLNAAANGWSSISSMLMLVLPMFGSVYVLLTFYRVCRAAR
jgi:hypothetical protein